MSNQPDQLEQERKRLQEQRRIEGLCLDALKRIGRENYGAVILELGNTLGGGDVPDMCNWKIRATSKGDDGSTAKINLEFLPEETDQKITAKLIGLFSDATWTKE
jgi:hypothetical protein